MPQAYDVSRAAAHNTAHLSPARPCASPSPSLALPQSHCAAAASFRPARAPPPDLRRAADPLRGTAAGCADHLRDSLSPSPAPPTPAGSAPSRRAPEVHCGRLCCASGGSACAPPCYTVKGGGGRARGTCRQTSRPGHPPSTSTGATSSCSSTTRRRTT